MDWSNVFRIVWNGLIWVGVIRINVNQVRIVLFPIYNWVVVIPVYRIFAPKIFNIEFIFVLSISKNCIGYKVFH